MTVEKKVNEILNRLEKTKSEKFPDLAAEKESRDREERNEKKAQIQEMKRREKEEMKKKREMDELRYDGAVALLLADTGYPRGLCSQIFWWEEGTLKLQVLNVLSFTVSHCELSSESGLLRRKR